MCLEIKKGQDPISAAEDIVCYKVLSRFKKTGWSGKFAKMGIVTKYEYQTLFRGTEVTIGETYESKIEVTCRTNYIFVPDMVTKALHSYKNLYNAACCAKNNGDDFTIVQCTIPKGSTYYEGKFNLDDSYACNRLSYDKIIAHGVRKWANTIYSRQYRLCWYNAKNKLVNSGENYCDHGRDIVQIFELLGYNNLI
jgi:hypothetical protein